MPLKIITVPYASIARDPRNARDHGDRDLEGTSNSIIRFGQQEALIVRPVEDDDRPYLDESIRDTVSYVTVAGAGRHESMGPEWITLFDREQVPDAERAGKRFIDEVPLEYRAAYKRRDDGTYVINKVDVIITSLRDLEAAAYGIAANQTGLNAEWSYERLAERLTELKAADEAKGEQFDIKSLGFRDYEVRPMLESTAWHAANKADPGGLEATQQHRTVTNVYVTPEQRKIFDLAAAVLRELESDNELLDGQILELMSANFLAMHLHDRHLLHQLQETAHAKVTENYDFSKPIGLVHTPQFLQDAKDAAGTEQTAGMAVVNQRRAGEQTEQGTAT